MIWRGVTDRIKGKKQLPDCIDWESSVCRADKLKEDVIEAYKFMSGLEKMNRDGDS